MLLFGYSLTMFLLSGPSAPAVTASGGVTATRGVIEGVPVTSYTVDDGVPKPVILLLHGYQSNKEEMELMAQALAGQNIFVLCPDAYQHGERGEGDELSVLEIAVRSAGEVDRLLDAFGDDANADTDRVSLMGFSMGGFASYYYWAHGERQPVSVVAFAASPDWEEMIGRDIIYGPGGTGDAERERIDAFVRAHNPYELLEDKRDTQVLLIAQPQDPLVPMEGMQRLYDTLSAQTPDSIELLVDETGKHSATEASVYAIVEFVGRVLGS